MKNNECYIAIDKLKICYTLKGDLDFLKEVEVKKYIKHLRIFIFQSIQ